MDRLPIDDIRERFLAAFRGAPLVVMAPTGSGKSTRLPVWMAEALGGPVLVVEPRRVACRSLASYVSQKLGGRLGGHVGYRIRFDDRSAPGTRILFVTPGMALRLLRNNAPLPFRGVMLDEFHERSWEVDLVATLLMHRAREGMEALPLVVTSATLEAEAMTAAFGGRCLETQGRSFPVTVAYPDFRKKSGKMRNFNKILRVKSHKSLIISGRIFLIGL